MPAIMFGEAGHGIQPLDVEAPPIMLGEDGHGIQPLEVPADVSGVIPEQDEDATASPEPDTPITDDHIQKDGSHHKDHKHHGVHKHHKHHKHHDQQSHKGHQDQQSHKGHHGHQGGHKGHHGHQGGHKDHHNKMHFHKLHNDYKWHMHKEGQEKHHHNGALEALENPVSEWEMIWQPSVKVECPNLQGLALAELALPCWENPMCDECHHIVDKFVGDFSRNILPLQVTDEAIHHGIAAGPFIGAMIGVLALALLLIASGVACGARCCRNKSFHCRGRRSRPPSGPPPADDMQSLVLPPEYSGEEEKGKN